jgi:hypothetical protein
MPLVKRVFGWGENGFEIGSCQFALHFFCENVAKFHGFMQNLSENIKIGGVFICTTFDGQRLFDKLRRVTEGDSWTLYGSGIHGGERIFQITKRYSETGFPSDEMGLGYGVDVYQESINKTFREYLVHPEFLKNVMFDYGFTLVRREEAEQMGFERGTDSFEALHYSMMKGFRGNGGGGEGGRGEYGMAEKMSREEKEISFLNRYYIFRKRHTVDAGQILKQRQKRLQAEDVWAEQVMENNVEISSMAPSSSSSLVEEEPVEVVGKEKKVKFRKITALKKVVLGTYSPVREEKEDSDAEAEKEADAKAEAVDAKAEAVDAKAEEKKVPRKKTLRKLK